MRHVFHFEQIQLENLLKDVKKLPITEYTSWDIYSALHYVSRKCNWWVLDISTTPEAFVDPDDGKKKWRVLVTKTRPFSHRYSDDEFLTEIRLLDAYMKRYIT